MIIVGAISKYNKLIVETLHYPVLLASLFKILTKSRRPIRQVAVTHISRSHKWVSSQEVLQRGNKLQAVQIKNVFYSTEIHSSRWKFPSD